jgi:hypothetical protein
MTDLLQTVIAFVGVYFIIRLIRTTPKQTTDMEAYLLLLELQAADKVMNLLPTDLRQELHTYLESHKASQLITKEQR